jgi:hypothetical protein
MKAKISIFYFLFVITIIWSCDGLYYYEYEVTNDSSLKVTVKFEHNEGSGIWDIGIGNTQKIFTIDHGIEGGNGPHFSGISEDIFKFEVKNSEGKISNRDYLQDESWEFYKGKYMTTVSDDEF